MLLYIYKKYSRTDFVTELYGIAGLQLLELRRKINRLKCVFFLIYPMTALVQTRITTFSAGLFHATPLGRRTSWLLLNILVKQTRLNFIFFFFPRTIIYGNSLPNDVFIQGEYALFVREIYRHFFFFFVLSGFFCVSLICIVMLSFFFYVDLNVSTF